MLLLVFLLAGCQPAQPTPRPATQNPVDALPREVSLNQMDIPQSGSGDFRFLVVGHLYGTIDGDDNEPDHALVTKIPALKNARLNMLVSLGDMVKHSRDEDFNTLSEQLLNPLEIPVFNTPGNHDVEDRSLYEFRYGQTFYSFKAGSSRMIFLDTERQPCNFDTAQQKFLSAALLSAQEDEMVKNVFIFMHKTLFFKNDALYNAQNTAYLPNETICYNEKNFAGIMESEIQPVLAKKPVYLFAGDVGAWGNLTPYYEQHTDLPLTMIMTGLGDQPKDAGIFVTIQGADVHLELYPLTDNPMPALDTFSPTYWDNQIKQK